MARAYRSVGADAPGTHAGAQSHHGRALWGRTAALADLLHVPEAAAMTLFDGLVALGRWGQQHPQAIWGTMGGALVLGMVLRAVTGGHRRHRDMHGSARWATYGEVKRSGLSRTQGVVVGVMQEQTFYDNGPKHVFLCGPTRAGKGVFHIQPTLQVGWKHSALILDPKRGENYDHTHRAREAYGRVEAFAPYRRPLACINVLKTIRLQQLPEHGDALTIAQS